MTRHPVQMIRVRLEFEVPVEAEHADRWKTADRTSLVAACQHPSASLDKAEFVSLTEVLENPHQSHFAAMEKIA